MGPPGISQPDDFSSSLVFRQRFWRLAKRADLNRDWLVGFS
jgi:hypothetical protein